MVYPITQLKTLVEKAVPLFRDELRSKVADYYTGFYITGAKEKLAEIPIGPTGHDKTRESCCLCCVQQVHL